MHYGNLLFFNEGGETVHVAILYCHELWAHPSTCSR